jgi:lipoate-protein ligase A
MPDILSKQSYLNVLPFIQDESLISAMKKKEDPQFFCGPFPHSAIVIGRGSSINEEVQMDNVLSDAIPVFQRKGGGCAVFLDPGNLIVSIAFPAKGFLQIQSLFQRASVWLIRGLKQSGIKTIYQDGISDLVIDNKKAGGSCFYRAKGLAYFSASILVSCDLNLMERYLYPPPREPEYRRGRCHKDFITSLDYHFPAVTVQSLTRNLKMNLNPLKLLE